MWRDTEGIQRDTKGHRGTQGDTGARTRNRLRTLPHRRPQALGPRGECSTSVAGTRAEATRSWPRSSHSCTSGTPTWGCGDTEATPRGQEGGESYSMLCITQCYR